MNHNDIERIAAGTGIVVIGEAVVRLCKLVAAAEREACAQLCEKEFKDYDWADREQEAAEDCAKAIRARSET